jgi:predicted enzyme related to lactoylglutathione lyase
MGRPVTWFEVIAKDAEKAQKFYSQLFDWKIDSNNPMKYGMIDTGGKGGFQGGIGQANPQMPIKGVTVYVDVEDPKSYLAKAEKLGGKTVLPPMDIPGGPTIAAFSDPDGNVIGLVKSGAKM